MMHSIQNNDDLGITSQLENKVYINFMHLQPFLYIAFVGLLIGLYQILLKFYGLLWVKLEYFIVHNHHINSSNKQRKIPYESSKQHEQLQQRKQQQFYIESLMLELQLIIFQLVPTAIVFCLKINPCTVQLQQPWRIIFSNALPNQLFNQRRCQASTAQLRFNSWQHPTYIGTTEMGDGERFFVWIDKSLNSYLANITDYLIFLVILIFVHATNHNCNNKDCITKYHNTFNKKGLLLTTVESHRSVTDKYYIMSQYNLEYTIELTSQHSNTTEMIHEKQIIWLVDYVHLNKCIIFFKWLLNTGIILILTILNCGSVNYLYQIIHFFQLAVMRFLMVIKILMELILSSVVLLHH